MADAVGGASCGMNEQFRLRHGVRSQLYFFRRSRQTRFLQRAPDVRDALFRIRQGGGFFGSCSASRTTQPE